MTWKIGQVYNHTGSGKDERNPYYGPGWRCTFITRQGYAVLECADDWPPKLDLPTFWVEGAEADYGKKPLVTGTQMDYMERP